MELEELLQEGSCHHRGAVSPGLCVRGAQGGPVISLHHVSVLKMPSKRLFCSSLSMWIAFLSLKSQTTTPHFSLAHGGLEVWIASSGPGPMFLGNPHTCICNKCGQFLLLICLLMLMWLLVQLEEHRRVGGNSCSSSIPSNSLFFCHDELCYFKQMLLLIVGWVAHMFHSASVGRGMSKK